MSQTLRGTPEQGALSGSAVSAGLVAGFATPISPAPDQRPTAADGECRLLAKVYGRCHTFMEEACRASVLPVEFLGALTANESGGDPTAVRFEPAVYRHLRAVAVGESARYGEITSAVLGAELGKLTPEAPAPWAAPQPAGGTGLDGKSAVSSAATAITPGAAGADLSPAADEALRQFASSWGFVQIMGYQVIGRKRGLGDLIDPAYHYQLAHELLAEFARSYRLDLSRQFEELFRCWNTGGPQGQTADLGYVEKGLRRMQLYRDFKFQI